MKYFKLTLLLVFCGSVAGFAEYRVQQAEKKVAFVASHAMANTQMANQAVMMVQNFYDNAPREIIKLVASTKCNCGQDRGPAITITSESNNN